LAKGENAVCFCHTHTPFDQFLIHCKSEAVAVPFFVPSTGFYVIINRQAAKDYVATNANPDTTSCQPQILTVVCHASAWASLILALALLGTEHRCCNFESSFKIGGLGTFLIKIVAADFTFYVWLQSVLLYFLFSFLLCGIRNSCKSVH